MADRLKSLDRKRTDLMPGTRLVREWDRQSHRVVVLADGLSGTATYVLTLPEAAQPASTTPAFCILSSSLSCVASTSKSLVTVMSLGLSEWSPTDRLSGHSGNPALRRLSV